MIVITKSFVSLKMPSDIDDAYCCTLVIDQTLSSIWSMFKRIG